MSYPSFPSVYWLKTGRVNLSAKHWWASQRHISAPQTSQKVLTFPQNKITQMLHLLTHFPEHQTAPRLDDIASLELAPRYASCHLMTLRGILYIIPIIIGNGRYTQPKRMN